MPIRSGGDVEFGVRITSDNEVFINGVKASTREVEKLGAGMKQVAKDADGASKSQEGMTASVFKGVTAMEVLKRGIDEVVNVFRQLVGQTQQAEQANARMVAVLRATQGASGQTADSLDELAKSMAKASQFDDEEIKNASTTLLTFKEIAGESFERVIRLSADLAATGRGDLNTWVTILAKAGTAPAETIGLAERSLGKFDAQLKVAIQNAADMNDKMRAQSLLFGEIERRVGGTATETYAGLTRKIEGTSKAWNDLLKTMGAEIFNAKSREASVFETALTHMAETFKTRIGAMKEAFSSLGSFGDVLRVLMGLPPEYVARGQQEKDSPKYIEAQITALRQLVEEAKRAGNPFADLEQSLAHFEARLQAVTARGSAPAVPGSPASAAASGNDDLLTMRQRQQLREQDLANLSSYLGNVYKQRQQAVDRERALVDFQHDAGLVAEADYFAKIGELGARAEEDEVARIQSQIAYTKAALGIASQELARARAAEKPEEILAAELRVAEGRSKLRDLTLDLASAEARVGTAAKKRFQDQYLADAKEMDRLDAISRDQADYERSIERRLGDLQAEIDLQGVNERQARIMNETRQLAIAFEQKRLELLRQIADEEAKGAGASKDVIARLNLEIEELQKKLKDALGQVPKLVNETFDRRTFAELANNIGDALKTGWDAWVSGAGNAGQRAWEALKRTFFDLVWKEFAKPIILNLVGSVLNGVGANAIGTAVTTAGGSGVGSGVGSAISSGIGSWLGSTAWGGAAGQFWGGMTSQIAGPAVQGSALAAGENFAAALEVMQGPLLIFAAIIGGIVASSRLYGQGWGINGETNITSGAGQFSPESHISGLGFKIGQAFGLSDKWASILSGQTLVARTFGHRARQQDAVGIQGNITGSGVSGTNWADWSEQGGWFSGTPRGTDHPPFDASQTDFFGMFTRSLKSITDAFGGLLKVNPASALSGYNKPFNMQLNENGQPLSDEAITKLFSDLFGAALQEQVAMLFGSAGDTELQKWVTNLKGTGEEVTKEITDLVTAMQGLKEMDLKGLDIHALMDWMREGEHIGDTFQRVAGQYTQFEQAFSSDAQKLAHAQKFVTDSFADMGIAVPENTAAFYDLVHGLDLSTQAGRDMFEALMAVAPAFAVVANAAANAVATFNSIASQLSPQFGTNLAGSNLAGAATSWINKIGSGETIDQVIANLKAHATDAGWLAAAKTYAESMGALPELNALLGAFQGTLSKTSDSIGSLGKAASTAAKGISKKDAQLGIAEWLKGLFLSPSSPLTSFQKLDYAQDQYVENLMKAQRGDVGALSSFSQLAQQYLDQLGLTYGTSSAEYLQAFAAVTQQGAKLAGLSDARAVTAKDMKDGFKSVVDAIKELQRRVTGITEAVTTTGGQTRRATEAGNAAVQRAVSDGALTFGVRTR